MSTLAEAYGVWITTRSLVKPSTLVANKSHWHNHIEPVLGSRDLTSLTRADIVLFTANCAASLSPRSTRNILTTLSVILDFAVDAGYIPANPAAGTKRPKVAKMRPDNVLSPAQVDEMAHRHGEGGNVTQFLAWTGLRWGEMAGLQVSDYRPNPFPALRVARTLSRIPGQPPTLGPTKTHAVRTVPVPTPALPALHQALSGKLPGEPIFTSPNGSLLHESNWRRSVRWNDVLEEMHLVGFKPHDLRHTAASYWIACGADIKEVQHVMGHASAQMTLDVYGHLLDQGLGRAAQRMNTWAASSARRDEGIYPQ